LAEVKDGTHESPKYHSAGIPFITSKNLVDGNIDFSNVNYISETDHESFSRRSNVEDGDILFGMIGTIGNPVRVQKDREFSIKNVALIKSNKALIDGNSFIKYLSPRFLTSSFR
jgi:type I restriction enzyme S subunit